MSAHYQILDHIGTTAGSHLYHAQAAEDGAAVVLKLPEHGHIAANAKRFRREYEILSALNLAGVIKPLTMIDVPGRQLMVLQNVEGEPLERFLGQHQINLPLCLQLSLQITRILAGLHAAHIIHRDIRPANLLLGARRQLWLTDVSRATCAAPPGRATNNPAVADWAYTSPEQTGHLNRAVDYRTDFYSLGVTLYQMLTGELPFHGNDALEWAHCHIAGLPRPPAELRPEIPAPVSDIVMKLLAKMPEQRYQSALGLEHDLQACLTQWEAHATIVPFALGSHDRSEQLQLPPVLLGREQESRQLLENFDAMASSGRAALLLVCGPAGVGKSALVEQLHQAIMQQHGYFIAGKFDQYQREIPYATITHGFSALVHRILAESAACIAEWRRQIQQAVGVNGRLMTDVLPQLELIIGAQPAVPELPAAQAQNRLCLVFQKFIGVFARQAHPVTLFLDDLHWADPASLWLLRELLRQPESRYLLVVGAFRDNETGPTHPLTQALSEMQQEGAAITRIALTPLPESALAGFIEAMLQCRDCVSDAVTHLIYRKTAGNPFFVIQFMTALAEEHMFAYDAASNAWHWDLDGIHLKGYTDNVAELMVDKLARLPLPAREALQTLACLGSDAPIGELAQLCRQTPAQMKSTLSYAIKAGLLLDAEGSVSFLHDHVQEAAYLSIAPTRRAALHLQIGRRLMAGKTAVQIEDAVFTIVGQLNRGAACINTAHDKAMLRHLNWQAGKKARAAIAYASACTYLEQARALLPEAAWQRLYRETFALMLALTESEYLAGNFPRVDQLANQILAHARTSLDLARVYLLRMQFYQVAGRYDDAINTMREAARLFEVHFPTSAAAIEATVDADVRSISRRLQGRRIADLASKPHIADADIDMAIALLVEVIPAVYGTTTRPDYFAILSSKAVALSLCYGASEGSCYAFINYGTVLLSRGSDIGAALEFADLALRLNQNTDGRRLRGRLLVAHAVAFSPFKDNFSAISRMLEQGREASLEVGDLVTAGHAALCSFWLMLQQGNSIDSLLHAVHREAAFARASHNHAVWLTIRFQQQLVANLKGETRDPFTLDGDDFEETEILAALEKAHFGFGLQIAFIVKQICAFVQGDYAGALAAAQQAARHAHPAGSLILLDRIQCFYYALTLAALYPQASAELQHHYAGLLAQECARFASWAAAGPQNFENCHALIGAEIARIEGRASDAGSLYEQALGAARENGFIQHEAITFELAAAFYRARNFTLIADTYLQQARAAYARWGATGKLARLEAGYPQLRIQAAPAEAGAAAQLDVLSVAKASQAISGHIVLNELADTLLHIVLENAGAQSGALLLAGSEGLALAAEAKMEQAAIQVSIRDPATPAGVCLPAAILNYVRHSRQPALVADLSQPSPFGTDPYFHSHHPKSVLCLPILRQDTLIGLLYLENNLVTHAFAPQRVCVLKLLASQAAISLENAQLYANLLKENREREQAEKAAYESAQTLRELVEILPTGVFVCDAAGAIESYNRSALALWGHAPPLGEPADQFCSMFRLASSNGATLRHSQCPSTEALITGRPTTNQEIIVTRPDGSTRTIILNVVARRDRQGRTTGIINCMTDITDQKNVQEALRKSESRVRRLVDANIIGVIFWCTNGRIMEANDAFLALLGFSRQDLEQDGLECHRLTPPEYNAVDERAVAELMKTGVCTPFEKEYIRKDGSRIPVLIGGAMLEDSTDQAICFVLDLSARKQAEERTFYMAHHDALTDLPNRLLFQDRMQQAIANARRAHAQVAFLFIDLDYFKVINDSLGHHIGDEVLQMAAQRLKKCLREEDSLARLGGDEFVLSLPLLSDNSRAANVAQKALDALAQPFKVEGHELHVTASIGISLFPDDGADVETLMRTADTAMYHAKEMGRGNFQFFTARLNHVTQQRLIVNTRLRQALAQHEFVLHFQPQVNMQSGVPFSMEALLRWKSPGKAAISCGAFIANAEESGLIVPIGEWALRQACRQLKIWHDGGHPELKMAVNLSPRQLEQADFCQLIRQILDETGINPTALELEITESILMRRNEAKLATLNRLCDMGIQLSIDDFGTGYSSLAYLQRFPVHALKIDQSFVRDIGTDPNDTALITAIIAMAASLHLRVIGEGVETSQQAQFLLAHGCVSAQGFYYSKAVPAETLTEWFKTNSHFSFLQH